MLLSKITSYDESKGVSIREWALLLW